MRQYLFFHTKALSGYEDLTTHFRAFVEARCRVYSCTVLLIIDIGRACGGLWRTLELDSGQGGGGGVECHMGFVMDQ